MLKQLPGKGAMKKLKKKVLIVKTNKNTISVNYLVEACNWTKIQQKHAARKMTDGTKYVALRIIKTENIIDALTRYNTQRAPKKRDIYLKLAILEATYNSARCSNSTLLMYLEQCARILKLLEYIDNKITGENVLRLDAAFNNSEICKFPNL